MFKDKVMRRISQAVLFYILGLSPLKKWCAENVKVRRMNEGCRQEHKRVFVCRNLIRRQRYVRYLVSGCHSSWRPSDGAHWGALSRLLKEQSSGSCKSAGYNMGAFCAHLTLARAQSSLFCAFSTSTRAK